MTCDAMRFYNGTRVKLVYQAKLDTSLTGSFSVALNEITSVNLKLIRGRDQLTFLFEVWQFKQDWVVRFLLLRE